MLPFPRALFPSSSSLSLYLYLVPFFFLLFSIRPSLLWPILFSSLLFSFSSSYILDADSGLRTEESGCLFSPVSSILFLFVSSASDCYSLLSLRFFLRLVLLPLFLFWHRLCFSWLLWVLGPSSSSSLSLVFRASFHYPFSGHLVLCRVPCFCLRTVFVRRVQGLTSLSCFFRAQPFPSLSFFPSLFWCLFVLFFWVSLAGWFLRVIGSVVYWSRFQVLFPESFVSRVLYLICGCRIRHIGTGVGFWQFRHLWEQGCCFCAFSSFLPRLHWFSQDLTSAEDLLIFSYLFPLLSSYSSLSLHLIFCFDLILQ